MRAKRSTRGVVFLLASIAFAGCDDFLATEPRAELTTENFFETADHAVQATNATYSWLREWQVHVFSWIGQTDIASDDATKGSTPGDAGFLGDLDNLNFDPGNVAFRDPWVGYYRGVYRANVGIENIPNVEMDDALKARLIGENKFLRAYYYFFLVRSYGGVPLITTALRPEEFLQPRATAEEIYDLIVQDLLDAVAVLPESYSADEMGRATRGAAHGLLAQVYLYRGDYENALAQAQAVIASAQYGLLPEYATIFTDAGEFSSESVFEVPAVALEEGGGGSQYAQVQGVRGTPNIGWGFNTPSDGLEAAYEPGDPRLQATILYPWELLPDGSGLVVYLNPTMQNNRYSQKVFLSPNTPGGQNNGGVNIRRLRYSDVLLIAAEAAHQTGDEATARQFLNMVRQRARAGQTLTLGFTAERLAEPIAVDVLGLTPGSSRIFVRYVNPTSAAYAAGLRPLTSECADASCASAATPPVRVTNIDVIQQVDGSPVSTVADYVAAVEAATSGQDVTLDILRVTQDEGGTTSQNLSIMTTAAQLLADVTASGQDLLEAIWRERRVELAMEQHRWFDIRRQNDVMPGRAAQLMTAVGLTFVEGRHELNPVPASEVEIAGLTQNPGYN